MAKQRGVQQLEVEVIPQLSEPGIISGKFSTFPLVARVLEDLPIPDDPRRAELNCAMSLAGEDCHWHHSQRDLAMLQFVLCGHTSLMPPRTPQHSDQCKG